MENTRIVNIINFIRGSEPRFGRDIDLFLPVREQMALAKKHRLPTTWLLQYDALVRGPYTDFLKREMPENHEAGIWFEVVEELAHAADIPWRGRWNWDWNVESGMSVGYTPEERERLADAWIKKFTEVFGYSPTAVGSWVFDARLLAYLRERYGIRAACNCKDQYGTDGYTLWGGYWANAYYPSRKNSYLPAQNREQQIDLPVFRMLGSDPLYQYTAGIGGKMQSVVSLEPVYPDGGGNREWIEWFFRENFGDAPHGALAYAQVGQENSFGWQGMEHGLKIQFEMLEKMRDNGICRVETLTESGDWFRRRYDKTPVSAVVTMNDWKKENHAGIWYLSALGRVNLFREENRELTIRDWQMFRENYVEPFHASACPSNVCAFDALPLLDGCLWFPSRILFPDGPGEIVSVAMPDAETMDVVWKSDCGSTTVIRLTPGVLDITFDQDGKALCFECDIGLAEQKRSAVSFSGGEIRYRHCGEDYGLKAVIGSLAMETGNSPVKFHFTASGKRLVIAQAE